MIKERMYQKRLRGYAAIGYKAKDTASAIEEIHSIFDNRTFFSVYSTDVMAAKSEVVIVSPFLAKRRILADLQCLVSTGAKATVITKPPENYSEKDRWKIENCINILTNHSVTVKLKDRIHQKFAVIDQLVSMVWECKFAKLWCFGGKYYAY